MVRIKLGERLVYEGAADQPRPDIDRVYGLSGAMGFSVADIPSLETDEDARLSGVELCAQSGPGEQWSAVSPPRETFRTHPLAGRPNEIPDLALEPLRLDLIRNKGEGGPVLEGLSVLDIGCSERGVYRKASVLGARRVVAIDLQGVSDEGLDAVTVIKSGLWDIPNEIFDVIFLSALCHEAQPKRYLRKLRDHLSPDGVLIVECEVGRSGGLHQDAWTTVRVGGDFRRLPSSQILKDDLLEGYVVRPFGVSDEAAGSAFPRRIYHCRPLRTTVVLIAAKGGAGKSVIAQQLKAKGFRTFSLDAFLRRVIQSDDYDWSKLAHALRPFRNAPTLRRLDQVGRLIVGEHLAEEFAAAVLQDVSLETPLLFIEGEILIHDPVRSALEAHLRKRGVTAWTMTPSLQDVPRT